MNIQPGYLTLAKTGELKKRAEAARAILHACRLCPRCCDADRFEDESGYCQSGSLAIVCSYGPHPGEERPISGVRGSGTVFFGHCSLGCVFCQNHDISQVDTGIRISARDLSRIMLELQEMRCHNINLVTPTHVVPQILDALCLAASDGLNIPLVYNSSGYDSVETLKLLDGVVDIYMPDFKFWSSESSMRYLNAPDYPEKAKAALKEMHRQVGPLAVNESGIAERGLLVRHLVMPGCLDETRSILEFLAELSPETYVNIMPQYRPEHNAYNYPEISRPITREEFREAVQYAQDLGLRLDDRRIIKDRSGSSDRSGYGFTSESER